MCGNRIFRLRRSGRLIRGTLATLAFTTPVAFGRSELDRHRCRRDLLLADRFAVGSVALQRPRPPLGHIESGAHRPRFNGVPGEGDRGANRPPVRTFEGVAVLDSVLPQKGLVLPIPIAHHERFGATLPTVDAPDPTWVAHGGVPWPAIGPPPNCRTPI